MTVKHFQVFLGNSAEEHSTIEWCSHVSTLSCQHVFIIFLILINNKSMMWEMTRIRHWLLNWVKPMTVKHFQVFLGNSAEEHSTIEWCSHVSTLSCQHVFIIFLILINNKSMMWEMTRIRCQGVSEQVMESKLKSLLKKEQKKTYTNSFIFTTSFNRSLHRGSSQTGRRFCMSLF